MITQVESSDATRQQAAANATTTAGKSTSFASVLAGAKKSATGGASPTPAAGGGTITGPTGEVWAPAAGHGWAQIVDGPRAGSYINLSNGARRGQVFQVETRDGKQVHVYGQGDSEVVVDAAHDATAARGHKIPAKEQWGPVKGGGNYADILSGPRNGMYVDLSGGPRDGMAFQIINKNGKVFHVYGQGQSRHWVAAGATTGSSATGGVSAPTKHTGPNGAISSPAGEEWRPVHGHDEYAEIMSGPRKGYYINLSHGDRRGQIFKVEYRHGVRTHVYPRAGGKEFTIPSHEDSGKLHDSTWAPATKRPEHERWAPSGAKGYALIIQGPRNGRYVDLSSGPRQGRTFEIVTRGSKRYRAYGSGSHPELVEIGAAAKHPAKAGAATSAAGSTGATTETTGATGATGGVSPT